MSTPYGTVPPNPPVIHIPATDQSIQETITAINNLIALMGSPAQQGTTLATLQQLAEFGAQPWVPNVMSASVEEQSPGVYTLGTPAAAFRVWGGYVAGDIQGSTGFSGTTHIFMRVEVGQGTGQLKVAHIHLGLGGPSQANQDSMFTTIPGTPFPANTPLLLNVNASQGVPQAVINGSGNIFYSIP